MALLRRWFADKSPEAEAIKLIGTQVWFWIAYAVGSYQTILLQDRGFSASVIGIINALMSAVAIVGNTAWGVVSDRTGSVRRVNMILMGVGYGAFAAIPFLAGLPGAVGILMVFIPLLNFFRGPTTVFLDNLTVRNSNGLGYGLYIGVAPNYIYDLAPDELKATAQALYASVTAAAGIVGNLLGGVLFDAVGAQPFYLITAGIFMVSILLFGGGLVLWGRPKAQETK